MRRRENERVRTMMRKAEEKGKGKHKQVDEEEKGVRRKDKE